MVQDAVREFFVQLGEDPDRNGLKETPKRFEVAIKYLLGGYDRSLEKENKLFENLSSYNGIISLRNIDFFSLCEHHLLPFFGYVHIAYIPSPKHVLGISKLSRAVDIYARRLQDQETLGTQIAEALMKVGHARGAAVYIEGKHFCNIARGVEKKMSIMTTCVYKGEFEKSEEYRKQFMNIISSREIPS